MSLANAFNRSSKDAAPPSGLVGSLNNPQAAQQTMMFDSVDSITVEGGQGEVDLKNETVQEQGEGEFGESSLNGGGVGQENGIGNGIGKRRERDGDGLLDQHDDEALNKRRKGPNGVEEQEIVGIENGLGAVESNEAASNDLLTTSFPATERGGEGGGEEDGEGDYNLPLEGLGDFGSGIDEALELQRFLESTNTSPSAAAPTGLPSVDDNPNILPNEEIPPPPPAPAFAPAPAPAVEPANVNQGGDAEDDDDGVVPSLEMKAESPSPDLHSTLDAAGSPVAISENEYSDDDDDAPLPPARLDDGNLLDIPNLGSLPDLPDLQVSAIPGSLEAPLRANYGNAPLDSSNSDGGAGGGGGGEGGGGGPSNQVDMIRQIFNINPAEEYTLMSGSHEASPVPGYGELPLDSSLDLEGDDGTSSLLGGLAPPAPAPKPKRKKYKTKKEKAREEAELAEEYEQAQQLQQEWVEPAPPPGPPAHYSSMSPGTYNSGSEEPVASGSGGGGGSFAKPLSRKGSKTSKNPLLRVVNARQPTPRNPNGSAPGASDFAPPEGGLTAREAAASFRGDESHAHPCPHVGCDKAFTRKSDFLRHYRIHTGERPFVCSHVGCGKSFIQRSALTVHERVHSGEKPHTCEDCSRQFSDSSSLARHRRIHQGLKPFKCEMCGNKSFSRRATLTRHQNICPGRPASDATFVPGPSTKSKTSKGKKGKGGAKTHPSVQFPGDGEIPPPPRHSTTSYGDGDSDYTGGSQTRSPEPDLSRQLGQGGSGGGEDDYDEDQDAEGEYDDGEDVYEDAVYQIPDGPGPVKVDDSSLPPIPPDAAETAETAEPSTTTTSQLGPSTEEGQQPEEGGGGGGNEIVSSLTEVPPAPPSKVSPQQVADDEKEAAAVAAAAKALDLGHAIGSNLNDGEFEDPSIPEEQAAAVAALVEGFISPHIKAENLE